MSTIKSWRGPYLEYNWQVAAIHKIYLYQVDKLFLGCTVRLCLTGLGS